ncbi:hypothetical protein, partial [Stenotrophomonas sp. GD03702]|uniref:hypothetical protein n=1 Tax=Stenotrophomonas sp. GD03702 TaxID=2975370 RepID=UPI00244AA884
MTPDPFDREFRSIQVEHAGSAECILRRSMKGVFGRAAPCTCYELEQQQQQKPVSCGESGWVR